MTRPAALLIACILALVVAGCGGSKVDYQEVTSAPPTLPIPRDTSAPANDSLADVDNASDAEATPTPDSTDASVPTDDTSTSTTTTTPTTPTDTTTDDTATAPAPVAPTDDTSGGAAPPEDTTTDEPADSGSGGATFGDEQFCADNPGAC